MSIIKHRHVVLWILVGLLLIGNVATYQLSKNKVYDFVGKRVEAAASDMRNRVNSRVSIYSTILYDTAAFVSTDNSLSVDDWNNYVAKSQLFDRYPGLDIISYSPVVFSSQESSFVQEAARRGVPNYEIYPSKSSLVEAPILFASSKNEDVRALLGFNLYSEAERKAALDYAASNNSIAVTNIITPVIDMDKPNPRKAVVAIMPIYRARADLSTPEKRQANIIGFIDAGFQPQEMMKNLSLSSLPGIQFQAFDNSRNGELTSANMLYNSGSDDLIQPGKTALFTHIEEVSWPNTKWYLRFVAIPNDLFSELLYYLPFLALAISIIVSVLLLLGIRKLLDVYGNLQLSASESSDRLIAEDAVVDEFADGIIATDVHGLVTVFNKKMEQISGYTELETVKQKTILSLLTNDCLLEITKRAMKEFNVPINKSFDAIITTSLVEGYDRIELEFNSKSGKKFTVPVEIKPLYSQNNFLLGYQFTLK